MNEINLGDLVLFKTHPYTYNVNPVKISANSLFTPPIMIVDQLTFSDVERSIKSKARCRFYDPSRDKIEELWFSIDELQLLNITSDHSSTSSYEQYARYTLKSGIEELKKLKAVFQVENKQTKTFATSLLNHLPPVFVVTDIVSISAKGDLKQKEFCQVGYKVKWFSPESGRFKEDILPEVILTKLEPIEDLSFIELAITEKWIYPYNLEIPVSIDSIGKSLSQSLFRIEDIRFNHISVILKVFDILLNREFEMSLSDFSVFKEENTRLFGDYFIDKYPKLVGDNFIYPHDIQLQNELVYGITYIDAQGEKTIRSIVVLRRIRVDSANEEGELLEAFCLLRCEIRYFWTKRIIHLFESNIKII